MSARVEGQPYRFCQCVLPLCSYGQLNGDLNDDAFSEDLYDLSDDDVDALTNAGLYQFPNFGRLDHRAISLLALPGAGD